VPQPCTICRHPRRAEIEAAYAASVRGAAGGGAKGVAAAFGVERRAIKRHAAHQAGKAPAPPAPTTAPPIPEAPAPSWAEIARGGLLAFIPVLSPEFAAPVHLAAWCALIERAARGEPVRALCDVPIRHYKSQTTMHGAVWALVVDPTLRILLMTHSLNKAQKMGRIMRGLARRCGVGPVYGSNRVDDWTNAAGGGIVCMSAAQSQLGADVHLVIFDDPLDELDAQSFNERSAADDAITHYTARCMRRGKPGGVLGVMSRWHPDDPIGRRLARRAVKWEHVHHPAVVEEPDGTLRAFAPEIWPLEELLRTRAELAEQDPTERLWWAQYQGEPRDPSGALFSSTPQRYAALPVGAFRLVYGADLAWSKHRGSDNFALVAIKVYGAKAYVIDMRRTKLETPQIEAEIRAMQTRHGPGPVFAYTSGPEVGIVKNLIGRGFRIVTARAKYNKLVRAEKTIRRHNDGDVLYPAAAPWLAGFFSRAAVFRGEDDGDDDDIDALVAACDFGIGGGGAPRLVGASYAGGSDVVGGMQDFR
jgi:predicted phage terminase large subunit-like protein